MEKTMETGNYYLGLYWGSIGIMEKKMETFLGITEKKMEATG